jgi:hypothetical protein
MLARGLLARAPDLLSATSDAGQRQSLPLFPRLGLHFTPGRSPIFIKRYRLGAFTGAVSCRIIALVV